METGECLSGYVRSEQMDQIISTMKGEKPRPEYPLNEDVLQE